MPKLNELPTTLPPHHYFDPDHYRRELESIWWKNWVCVARESEWSGDGAYRVIDIGGQQLVVVQLAGGELRAHFNTCRHRGSVLCEKAAGRFANGRIVCPYHAWTYALDGRLQRTPFADESALNKADYSLYPATVETWAGFVFVCLDESPGQPLMDFLGDAPELMKNWPLDSLALVHSEVHQLNCNWKLFWENFMECYHCPGVHPDLCKLVPLYRKATTSQEEIPADSPLYGMPRLREGSVTWSNDGTTPLPWFPDLTEQEQAAAMTYATLWPGMFFVAHVDYVRSVYVMPVGAEKTLLTVNWMVDPSVLTSGELDIERLVCFGRQVVLEDARACELNQRGLHSITHKAGPIMPIEEGVLEFHNWIRDAMSKV